MDLLVRGAEHFWDSWQARLCL